MVLETAGFALSVVSLLALFEPCIKVCDKIIALGRFENDLEDASITLLVEKHILNNTLHRLQERDLEGQVKMLIPIVMKRIQNLLTEIENTIMRNFQRSESNTELVVVHEHTQDSNSSKGSRKLIQKQIVRKIKWVAGDKDLLDEKFGFLRYLTNALTEFATSDTDRIGEAYLLRHAAMEMNHGRMPALARACHKLHPDIANVARVKTLLDEQEHTPAPSQEFGILVRNIDWTEARGLNHAVSLPFACGTIATACLELEVLGKEIDVESNVLVEWRGPFMSNDPEDPASPRLDGLCQLLRSMKVQKSGAANPTPRLTQFLQKDNVDFGILECLGWTSTSDAFERIGLVYRFPSGSKQPPRTLHEIIAGKPRDNPLSGHTPELGARFKLAYNLTTAVANILAVGWVHRSVRSTNVLVFDNDIAGKAHLVGLTYAQEGYAGREFSNTAESPDSSFTLPPFLFSQSHPGSDDGVGEKYRLGRNDHDKAVAIDMFGVGIILLEIGLWRTCGRLAKAAGNLTPRQFQEHSLRDCVNSLLPRCGSIYHRAVELCLYRGKWRAEGWEIELAKLLSSLRECRA